MPLTRAQPGWQQTMVTYESSALPAALVALPDAKPIFAISTLARRVMIRMPELAEMTRPAYETEMSQSLARIKTPKDNL